MSTWTCKGLIAAAFLALVGCDEAAFGPSSQALLSADLGNSGVRLVPPQGYCIDRRSLRASFALMARCDTLGGERSVAVPLAVITATATPRLDDAASAATNSETVLGRLRTSTLAMVQVRGTPPSPTLRDVYWRGVGDVGDHVLGLAIYESKDGANLGEQAPELLVQAMQRTLSQTAARTAQAANNSAPSP
ncbi:hypothetical protein [uncultured Tateyamaria sp.]|uniref:hypothetical protein n=1 Tax=uncultured Tateyamaria sp. TaxID=455651 RepID=UPI002604802B|nr:hypothetical protein [uncultured Tateyamaria sp.]